MISIVREVHFDLLRPDDLIIVPPRIVGLCKQLFFVAEIQCGRTRDTGAQPEDIAGFTGEPVGIPGNVGPGAHERHGAGKHVPELRQLVEFVPPEKPSDWGDTGIGSCGNRPLGLRSGIHGPEFDRREELTVSSHPLLRIENGAAGGKLDGKRNNHGRHKEEEDTEEREDDVEEAFHCQATGKASSCEIVKVNEVTAPDSRENPFRRGKSRPAVEDSL